MWKMPLTLFTIIACMGLMRNISPLSDYASPTIIGEAEAEVDSKNNNQDNSDQNIIGRLLSPPGNNTDDNENKNDESGKGNVNVGVVIIIIVVAFLFGGGCIYCIFCIVPKIISPRLGRSSGARHVVNIALSYDLIFPTLPYKIFRRQVGQPKHDSCVICLEEFQLPASQLYPPSTNLLFTCPLSTVISQPDLQQNIDKNGHLSNDTVMVRYTVCGHLLHEKCLMDWLIKQKNCPTCRESFTEQNLFDWLDKLTVSYEQLLCQFKNSNEVNQQKKHNTGNEKEDKNKITSSSMTNVRQLTSFPMNQNNNAKANIVFDDLGDLSNRIQINQDISQKDLYAVKIYRLVQAYHNTKVIQKQDTAEHKQQQLEASIEMEESLDIMMDTGQLKNISPRSLTALFPQEREPSLSQQPKQIIFPDLKPSNKTSFAAQLDFAAEKLPKNRDRFSKLSLKPFEELDEFKFDNQQGQMLHSQTMQLIQIKESTPIHVASADKRKKISNRRKNFLQDSLQFSLVSPKESFLYNRKADRKV